MLKGSYTRFEPPPAMSPIAAQAIIGRLDALIAAIDRLVAVLEAKGGSQTGPI